MDLDRRAVERSAAGVEQPVVDLQGVHRVGLAEDPLVPGLDHAQRPTGQIDLLDAAVVAAAEELAVHERHGPHGLARVDHLGAAAVPAQRLHAGALRHEARHGGGHGQVLHGVPRVVDLRAPEAVPELPHLVDHVGRGSGSTLKFRQCNFPDPATKIVYPYCSVQ